MSKGDVFENDFLKLIFNATPIANIADNAGTSPLTNLFVALHTADPGEAGNQTTSECTYTGYGRATGARTTGGWTVTNNIVTPVAAINFGLCTAGTNTATFASVGTVLSGTGKILWSGAISPTISISNGVTPQLTTLSTVTED